MAMVASMAARRSAREGLQKILRPRYVMRSKRVADLLGSEHAHFHEHDDSGLPRGSEGWETRGFMTTGRGMNADVFWNGFSSKQPMSTEVEASGPTEEDLEGARAYVRLIITEKHCNPILIRLAWHDSGTYDASVSDWPKCGGANGSIRFKPEISHGANAGLASAIALLEPVKEEFPSISYADLFQLGSAMAIEMAGGPHIDMRYGRVDAPSAEDCTPDGRLPDANPPSPADHLRAVFYRMGLNDQDIVALSGAHTLGRSRPSRSGFGAEKTRFTSKGPGLPGGQSWTESWLQFDNSYFKEVRDRKNPELLILPTDAVLFEDPAFKVYAERYANDQSAFFADYAKSHKKLSELGARFSPAEGIELPRDLGSCSRC